MLAGSALDISLNKLGASAVLDIVFVFDMVK